MVERLVSFWKGWSSEVMLAFGSVQTAPLAFSSTTSVPTLLSFPCYKCEPKIQNKDGVNNDRWRSAMRLSQATWYQWPCAKSEHTSHGMLGSQTSAGADPSLSSQGAGIYRCGLGSCRGNQGRNPAWHMVWCKQVEHTHTFLRTAVLFHEVMIQCHLQWHVPQIWVLALKVCHPCRDGCQMCRKHVNMNRPLQKRHWATIAKPRRNQLPSLAFML